MDAQFKVPVEAPVDKTVPAEGTFDRKVSPDGSKVIDSFQVAPKDSAAKPVGKPVPEGIPEKFWDAEKGVVKHDDMLKSYLELEKKIGQPPVEKKEEKPADKPADKPVGEKPPVDGEQAAKDALASKGLDLAPFTTEYAEKGELTPESYTKLETAGIPKHVVDSFIAGQNALAVNRMNEIFAETGGSVESYAQVMNWAKSGLSKTEAEAYNRIMDAGNHGEMKLAAKALHTKFVAAEGSDPALVGGDRRVSQSDVVPFRSWAQVTEAMRDPRYTKNDPAYHAEIDRRLAASSI